ncbi:MAG: hypothetical protein US67_C0071G0002 [Candidatus Woesebacteria bacterium GW2011_GWD1_38_10]|uniref:Uncharacterized protein n=1 Tax=Candidatus Woesebacteria bacterium GW2011_GWD1_38_10 TaxID=1618592 RepID=A0A0G0L201_9BACT|nr:MAG: hypothetical protein US67_C0071G0002 [Candidatus Woesebacteria bacterium GW2011_GWD1_38_10]
MKKSYVILGLIFFVLVGSLVVVRNGLVLKDNSLDDGNFGRLNRINIGNLVADSNNLNSIALIKFKPLKEDGGIDGKLVSWSDFLTNKKRFLCTYKSKNFLVNVGIVTMYIDLSSPIKNEDLNFAVGRCINSALNTGLTIKKIEYFVDNLKKKFSEGVFFIE